MEYEIKENEIGFTVTHNWDLTKVVTKASYDIHSLAHFIAEEMDDEMLAWSNYNEIEQNIRGILLNLSKSYIQILELLQKGKIIKHNLNCGMEDELGFVPNQLSFLDKLADAFHGITVELEEIKAPSLLQMSEFGVPVGK